MGWLLTPAEVGAAGAALAVVYLTEAFSSAGLQEAVIRARHDTAVSDTANTLALVLAGFAVAAVVAGAFVLEAAYQAPGMVALTLVASLILPSNALLAVPTALMTRKLRARGLTVRLLWGKLCGVAVLFLVAISGGGAWAIVLSILAASAASLLAMRMMTRRWPRLRFERRYAGELLRFGGLVGLDGLLWTIGMRLFSLLFGLFHGLAALGQMQFAMRLVDELARLLQSIVARFGLAYFAQLRRRGPDLKAEFSKATRFLVAIASPVFAGLAITAGQAIPLLFGGRWDQSVLFVQLFAIGWVLAFPRILLSAALRAEGRPSIMAAYSGISAAFIVAGVCVTSALSPVFAVLAWTAREIIAQPWSMWATSRFIGIPLARQWQQVSGTWLATIVMSCAVVALQLLVPLHDPLAALAASVSIGAAIYVGALAIFHPDAFALTLTTIRRVLGWRPVSP